MRTLAIAVLVILLATLAACWERERGCSHGTETFHPGWPHHEAKIICPLGR